MSVKLLTEHHLEVLSLKGGCTGWSESTFVKMPHCWKSRLVAHMSDRYKSAFRKINFLISHPKHMLWVLKRIVSMRRFF